ncbi:MAG: hypothetical protein V4614_02540 [Pseudomonadota bacterium]
MAELQLEAVESKVPLFDVVVRMPSGGRIEDIQRQAATTSLPADRIERLIKVLRSSPNAKVGAAVPLERAEQEKELFTKTGLIVEITPLLSIQTATAGSWDGLESCPACGKRVTMTATRQCPSCGVYVDKLTDDYLLKKKIMQQERGAIEFQQARSAKNTDKSSRDSVEAALRAKIRAEVQKEFGIKGEGKSGKMGTIIKGVVVLGVVGLAFFGGRGFTLDGLQLPWKKNDAAATNAAMSADSLKSSSAAGAAGAAAAGAAAAGGGEGGAPTGDADIDDPLIQAAGGKRIGGKGISIEQAVAAAQTLGKSVGNTTAERHINGAGGVAGAGGGAGGAAVAGAGGGAAGAAAASGGGTAAVPKQTKQVLTAVFATVLAEMGQGARSREVLKSLASSVDAAADTEEAKAFRGASLRAQAWGIQRMDGGLARGAADDLKGKVMAVSSPVERTQLLGEVAVILSRNPQLAQEVPRMFLTLGAESLKAVPSGQTNATLGDLAVSMAQVFSNETAARARAGAWNKAQASAAQIEGLIKQAPDAWAQSRLQAVDHVVQLALGNNDKAGQALTSALSQVGKSNPPLEQATRLRAIARLGDSAAEESFQAMTASLQAQLDSKSGMEKAQALTQLSLLYANAGLPAKAAQYREMAQNTAGLSATDSTLVSTDLIVRGDLAMARVLQSVGRYAEAEALVQKVGGYLF